MKQNATYRTLSAISVIVPDGAVYDYMSTSYKGNPCISASREAGVSVLYLVLGNN